MLRLINIKNFKSLYDVSLKLVGLNILAGVNGAGKSSIIQAILLLKQFASSSGVELPLRGEFVSLGTARDVLSGSSESDVITLSYGTTDNKRREVLDFDCSRGENDFLPLIFNPQLFEDYSESLKEVLNNLPRDIDFDVKSFFYAGRLRNIRNALKDFHYLSAARIEPQVAYQASSKFVRERKDLGIRGEYTAHYLSKNQGVELKNKRFIPFSLGVDTLTLLEAVNVWMGYITSKIQVIPRWNPNMNTATLSYRFVVRQDVTDEYSPVNVGFGVTYALPVVLSILKAEPGSILVVENPEAHLHPAAQVIIGKMCAIAAASGVQLIIETHSDHFLNGVRVAVKEGLVSHEEVAFFFMTHDGMGKAEVQQPKMLPNGRLDSWPEGFFDEWDNQLEKLL